MGGDERGKGGRPMSGDGMSKTRGGCWGLDWSVGATLGLGSLGTGFIISLDNGETDSLGIFLGIETLDVVSLTTGAFGEGSLGPWTQGSGGLGAGSRITGNLCWAGFLRVSSFDVKPLSTRSLCGWFL